MPRKRKPPEEELAQQLRRSRGVATSNASTALDRPLADSVSRADYTPDELEFLRACAHFEATYKRRFLSACEYLLILKSLGYRKHRMSDPAEAINPFTEAISSVEAFLASVKTQVTSSELVKAAAIGAFNSIPGWDPTKILASVDVITADLPAKVKAADQKLFVAALQLAELVYAHESGL
jgi:hypothetical protein